MRDKRLIPLNIRKNMLHYDIVNNKVEMGILELICSLHYLISWFEASNIFTRSKKHKN